MLIYVAIVKEHLYPVALRYFNTETGVFGEQSCNDFRKFEYLSVLDGLSLTKEDMGTCCVLGRYKQFYVVTLDCLNMQYLPKTELLKYIPVNYTVTSDDRVLPKGFKLWDLSHLFSKDTFYIEAMLSKSYSAGQQRKFMGSDLITGKRGVIKYPLFSGSKDILYEVLYYQIGEQLNLPVCEARLGVCCGRPCVLSVYEYNVSDDWLSFAKYMVRHNLKNEFEVVMKLNQVELFCCYLLLDCVCNQTDRHSRNLAVCNDKIYPLYDNGRAFTGTAGYASAQYRAVLERNIKQWNNQYSRVHDCIEKLKKLQLPQHPLEWRTIRQNLKNLEALL